MEITMENLDDFMFRDDVQYIDLRNYQARYSSGYIENFDIIPFFDYLDNRVFDRHDIYEFSPDQLLNENEMYRLFDQEKIIFLYADGCIRSGYIKDILDYLGYDKVFSLGGYFEYDGEYKVLGDGTFEIGNTFYKTYTETTTGNTYQLSGVYEMDKKIKTIRIDVIDQDGFSLRNNENPLFHTYVSDFELYIVSEVVTFNELYAILDENSDDISIPFNQIELSHKNAILELLSSMVIGP
jgi:rhodanese-related sulfurtransferase